MNKKKLVRDKHTKHAGLTVHVSFMLVFNEGITSRLACVPIIDDTNLVKDQVKELNVTI